MYAYPSGSLILVSISSIEFPAMEGVSSLIPPLQHPFSSSPILFFFWLHLLHAEIPGPAIEPVPQQRPKPLSDNAGSLTRCAMREFLLPILFNISIATRLVELMFSIFIIITM